MSCAPLARPISRLIEDALVLAGSPNNGASDGNLVVSAVEILNNILAAWSTDSHYIPYTDKYEFETDPTKTFYEIGQGKFLDTSPFISITGAWYIQSKTSVPILYETYRSFMNFTYKGSAGYPRIYTYELKKGYTELGLLPRGVAPLTIQLYGRKALVDVKLFDKDTVLPSYMIQPLTYTLANELIARGKGVPAENFQSNFSKWMDTMKAAPQIDTQGDIKPTLLNPGAVVPLGMYYGGSWGGFRGY